MRFLEAGANIPDELVRAATEGSATFLCGAGVSFRVGLPLFNGLTDQVYERLGELYDNEPAERTAIERDEFDRALRSLEKRTHRRGTPSRLREAVSDLLVAPNRPLPDHHALLQLSRNRDGKPRLLTTNFDTLFERAAQMHRLTDVPSHSCQSIPKPGSDRDHGILHLHGRISDATLGLSASDLVLTSADFGDAYLRDGWASRYIEGRMRVGSLVLVGYRAEDAAMRLLLEALDADRERFTDLKDIYAIEMGTHESASIWRAKGIKPIEFENYDALYAALQEWARYATNPTEYAAQRARKILTGSSNGNSNG